VGKRTVRDIKHALEDLPRGPLQLEKAYDRTISRIESQEPDGIRLAQRVFYWIVHAQWPLSAAELQAALAVRVGDTEPDNENLVRIDEALSLCAGLVTEDHDSDVIRLIHYTTKEYFMQSGASWIAASLECAASTCLTYLSFHNFMSGPCEDDAALEARTT
jgi:hypothetical protein